MTNYGGTGMNIVLASTSKNRQQLMTLAGIPFESVASSFDEALVTARNPQKRVQALALKKAEAVAKKVRGGIVIAADTIGVFNGKILEKPKFKTEAYERLKQLSGRVHTMITGWVVLNTKTKKRSIGLAETYVTFRTLSDAEILAYVNEHPVITWAAGYSPLNTTAIHFIEKIEGSLTGFSHGLPLEAIVPILYEEGAL